MVPWLALLTACMSPGPTAHAGGDPPLAWADDNPEELGRVRWHRGYDAARAVAAAEGKPLLVLFDEVPGCSTVRAYGRTVLSHPLVVDAAESQFVPVVVYNNVDGDDRRVLRAFGEPAWNNFVSADGAPLTERLTHEGGTGALLGRMVTALRAAERPVPPWLQLVAQELGGDRAAPARATYAMGCFWSGEAHLGGHDAVLATRTGFQAGHEVVEVTYDPARTSRRALDAYAGSGRARPAPAGAFRPSPRDDRYQLRGTPWAAVPMTAAQATRVNTAVGAGADGRPWLSPRQQQLLDRAKAGQLRASAGLGAGSFVDAFEAAIR